MAGSVLWAKWPCPSRMWIRALGIAAAARVGGLGDDGDAVGAGQQQRGCGDARRTGLAGRPSPASAWHSRGMVGAAARRIGHSGLARKASISSSVISRMSTSTATMAASWSPRGQRRLDAVDRAGRVGEAEAGFVEDEVVDVAGQGGAAHGAVGAVGVAPQGDGPAGAGGDGVDDGGDVVEVAFDRVVGGVAAGAEPSAVHGSRW